MQHLLIIVLLFISGSYYAHNNTSNATEFKAPLPIKKQEPLRISTSQGSILFQVEVVQSGIEMEQGLMFRKEVRPKTGMLFNFGSEGTFSMWMKNTFVPLDMLFIDSQGVIVDIATNTTPHSLSLISTKKPAMAVLEVAGSSCKLFGIHVGDTIEHPVFSKK